MWRETTYDATAMVTVDVFLKYADAESTHGRAVSAQPHVTRSPRRGPTCALRLPPPASSSTQRLRDRRRSRRCDRFPPSLLRRGQPSMATPTRCLYAVPLTMLGEGVKSKPRATALTRLRKTRSVWLCSRTSTLRRFPTFVMFDRGKSCDHIAHDGFGPVMLADEYAIVASPPASSRERSYSKSRAHALTRSRTSRSPWACL